MHSEQICQLDGCDRNVPDNHKTGRVHDFCSRRHADRAILIGAWPRDDSKGRVECKLSGCRELVYRDTVSGQVWKRHEHHVDACR